MQKCFVLSHSKDSFVFLNIIYIDIYIFDIRAYAQNKTLLLYPREQSLTVRLKIYF